jgi:transposase InsO family protein
MSGWIHHRCNRDKEDMDLTCKIKSIFTEGRGNYGCRFIKKGLLKRGIVASRRRIRRLMQEADLVCKIERKFKATTDSSYTKQVAPNILNITFKVPAVNYCWVGDITYIPTIEDRLYLAIVLDLFLRKIVGWSMDSNMKANLVNNAMLMALRQRKPSKELIWYTDRGSRYCADNHLKIIK